MNINDENTRLNTRRGWQHGEIGGPPWASQEKILAEATILREAIERTHRDERAQKLCVALGEFIDDEIATEKIIDPEQPNHCPPTYPPKGHIHAARKLIAGIDDYVIRSRNESNKTHDA